MKVPVSIASDLSSGWNNHICDLHLVPLPDYFDCSATMDWIFGKAFGKHSLASDRPVLHKGQPIVLDGHDLGPMLPHSPGGFFLHLLKASRKTIYSASTVRACKKPVACADAEHPLMLCGDIATPNGFNDTNSLHTVFVGTTGLDETKGKAERIKTGAVDIIMLVQGPGDGLTDVVVDVLGISPVKVLVNAGAGLVASVAVSHESGWKEPISIKQEWGGGFASGSKEWSWDPQTGETSTKESQNILGEKEEKQQPGLTSRDQGMLPGAWQGDVL